MTASRTVYDRQAAHPTVYLGQERRPEVPEGPDADRYIMKQSADIVIAGAGVIGLSIAVQLARRTRARILVFDRAAAPGAGSTGASSAFCRHKYSLSETVGLARDGIHAYRHWPDFLELNDAAAQFQNTGVLWLGDGRKDWPASEARRLSAHDVRVAVLDDAALRERFPAINPCVEPPDASSSLEGHVCGSGGPHLLELDGGHMDPVDVLGDLIRSARAKGVEVRFGTEVAGLQLHGGRVVGVRLADGGGVACPTLVSASGPWCVRLFANVGLPCPWRLEPTRVQIAHIDRPPEVPGNIPATIDPIAGIYFRAQNRGQQILVGSVLEEDEKDVVADPDEFATYADDDFMRAKLHLLEHRLRGLEHLKRPRGYSGLYTINRDDYHPVVGSTPIEGFLVANGFSGHGFKLAPAIGSLVAQMLAGRAQTFDTDVSPDFLAFDRKPLSLNAPGVLA
jgi:sarcosine oxidase subunit beta